MESVSSFCYNQTLINIIRRLRGFLSDASGPSVGYKFSIKINILKVKIDRLALFFIRLIKSLFLGDVCHIMLRNNCEIHIDTHVSVFII